MGTSCVQSALSPARVLFRHAIRSIVSNLDLFFFYPIHPSFSTLTLTTSLKKSPFPNFPFAWPHSSRCAVYLQGEAEVKVNGEGVHRVNG